MATVFEDCSKEVAASVDENMKHDEQLRPTKNYSDVSQTVTWGCVGIQSRRTLSFSGEVMGGLKGNEPLRLEILTSEGCLVLATRCREATRVRKGRKEIVKTLLTN